MTDPTVHCRNDVLCDECRISGRPYFSHFVPFLIETKGLRSGLYYEDLHKQNVNISIGSEVDVLPPIARLYVRFERRHVQQRIQRQFDQPYRKHMYLSTYYVYVVEFA
jgi:hypothetical protein